MPQSKPNTDSQAPGSTVDYYEILETIFNQPGRLMDAYRAFHQYSFRNIALLMSQCIRRHIEIGPVTTLKGWNNKGRKVRKGESALAMFMPITLKDRTENERSEEEGTRTAFLLRRKWFALAQTDPVSDQEASADASEHGAWDESNALKHLGIQRMPFEKIDGNIQGYAHGRNIAISPIAQMPLKTLFHEIAHVVLGHTHADHGDAIPQNIQEFQAEATALCCLEALGEPGAEFCRGYCLHWIQGERPSAECCTEIIRAASLILEAGKINEANPESLAA